MLLAWIALGSFATTIYLAVSLDWHAIDFAVVTVLAVAAWRAVGQEFE